MTNMLCVMSLKRIGEIPVRAYQSNEFASWLSTKTHKPMRSVSGFPANDNIHKPGIASFMINGFSSEFIKIHPDLVSSVISWAKSVNFGSQNWLVSLSPPGIIQVSEEIWFTSWYANISQFFIGVWWIPGVEFDDLMSSISVLVSQTCQLDAELCPEAKAKAMSFFGAHMLLLFLHQSILHIL